MDVLRLNSVRCTQFLQQWFGVHSPSTETARWISHFVDPTFIYLWIRPILCLIDPLFDLRLLFALTASEWAVQILKMFVQDDRPIWWFPTTDYSIAGASHNTIVEFPETCEELTSGFPSSRITICGAVSIVLLWHVLKLKLHKPLDDYISQNVLFVWLFVMINSVAILSRLLLATNFHYQLVFGSVLGSSIGMFACSKTFNKFCSISGNEMFGFSLLIMDFSALLWGIAHFMGNSSSLFWPVPLALKWCWGLNHVVKNLKRNPIFYQVRVLTSLFGFNISAECYKKRLSMKPFDRMETIIIAAIYLVEATLVQILLFTDFWTVNDMSILGLILHFFHIVFVSLLPVILDNYPRSGITN